MTPTAASGEFTSGGSGTASDPYIISDPTGVSANSILGYIASLRARQSVYFRWNVGDRAGVWTITTDASPTSHDFDLYGRDNRGSSWDDQDRSNDGDEHITVDVQAGGHIVLRVQNYEGGAPTDLTLSFEPPASTATDTPTPTPTTTGTATATPTATGTATGTPTPTGTPTATPTATVDLSSISERDALVALYNATDGDNWTNNDNWLSQEPISTWYGVTKATWGEAIGYVTSVDLFGNNLRGTIPAELGALDHLTYLRLTWNALSGTIPSELGNLDELMILYLGDNDLSGTIPSELGNLDELRILYLGDNDLSGTIPSELGNLDELRILYLGDNDLSGTIPSELGNIENLEQLFLAQNQLRGCIPDALRSLTINDFADLGLSFCSDPAPTPTTTARATPNPAVSAERAALVAFYNSTDGANWTKRDNWLSQEPVSEWYGISVDSHGRVTNLNLFNNGLNGELTDLSALSQLRVLYLHWNELSGSIPSELGDLSNLRELWLHLNELSGSIPSELGDLDNLTHLYLNDNDLSGSIPNLSTLTNLKYLSLSDNDLSGSIPNLSTLTNLEFLSLSDNDLSGSIPNLSTLTNLTKLYLSDNDLSGSIPNLSTLTNLEFLSLSDNDLSGSIPNLSTLTNLEFLSLSDNDLSGSISDLGSLAKLTKLYLNGNGLSGEIPDLSSLISLQYLDFSGNDLDGLLLDLATLTLLVSVDLSNNDFSGAVPNLSALTKLTSLNLAGNDLCQPEDLDLSSANSVVSDHMDNLNLSDCTEAELTSAPGAPQNLVATKGEGQVTLTWDAVTNAASYELWAWDSMTFEWSGIGSSLIATIYTHTVETDGRNYYYQVRARDANGQRGAWSERVVAVITSQFSPPPASFGFSLEFQKYMEVSGWTVVAPSRVPDGQMIRAGEIITGMFTSRSDLLEFLAAKDVFVQIIGSQGWANKWVISVSENDPFCRVFVHEVAHLTHFALEEQVTDPNFGTRLLNQYRAAMDAGLWSGAYASTDYSEYWAEAVTARFIGRVPHLLTLPSTTLAQYDEDVSALVEEVFGESALPASCGN